MGDNADSVFTQDLEAVAPPGDDTVSVLKRAINEGDTVTVEKLLDDGKFWPVVNNKTLILQRDRSGNRVIMVWSCNVFLVAWTGMDVETRLDFAWTPLMCAVSVGSCEVAKLLLDRGASANFSKGERKSSPHVYNRGHGRYVTRFGSHCCYKH